MDAGYYIQPRGVAAQTIRECVIGGFCQPLQIGEVKSGHDFCFYNNHFTQLDIVSMYANSQRSQFYADGKCQTDTTSVKKAIKYCNKILEQPGSKGLIQYLPIFGFYAVAPPERQEDRCSLGPIACKIKIKEKVKVEIQQSGDLWLKDGVRTTENVTWCGIPRFQALSPQDALTFKNLGWTIVMLETDEAVRRTVLFETFRGPIKEFCEIHIELKLDAKRAGNTAIEKLMKLIVNGLYGHTLMKAIHERVLTITDTKELTRLYSRAYCGEVSLKNVMECSYSLF